jgi:hypothetical protein
MGGIMRAWLWKIAVGLIIAGGVLATAAPRAQAETQTENIVAEMRTYLYLQVTSDAVQSFLPNGWTSSPVTAGAAKDANFVVLFIDRKLALTPDGKPLQAGVNRLLVLIVPSKNVRTGEVANMIVGGYSADPAGSPGAYKVYGPGAVTVDRTEQGAGKLESKVAETWVAKGQDGNELDLHINFVRGVPALSTFDLHNFSAADPAFYRIYRGEQVVDVLRSVNTGVNRVQMVELKASGSGKLAKAINGSEKIIAINALPFYRRLTFLP